MSEFVDNTIRYGMLVNILYGMVWKVGDMERKTQRDWLIAGAKIVAEQGAAALTTELLTTTLGVTKGSFYHHFKHLQDYKENLLAFYEREGTLRIIELAEAETAPAEKLQRVLEATLNNPVPLEAAVRAWALQDATARVYQERIDQQRVDYLRAIYLEMTGDEEWAAALARLIYSVYVGSQQIIPPIEGEALRRLYAELEGVLKIQVSR